MITTALRLIELLRLIPRRLPGATASELVVALKLGGWRVHLRTVQRDLQELSVRYPLIAAGKPMRWHWAPSAKAIQLPGVDITGATIWALIELHLRPLLPPALVDELTPQFDAASDVLKQAGGRRSWVKRIARISSGYPLLPPPIDPQIYRLVADCVAQRQCFRATYRGRYETEFKTFDVNPLGLVVRDQVIYLVASLWDYETPIQLAIHRFQAVEPLDKSAIDVSGFDLQSYANSAFGYPVGTTIKLKVRFSEEAGFHLTEALLATDQRIKRGNGSYEISATVADTLQLRWWLLGFGDGVEVLGPARLRAELAAHAKGMSKSYAVSNAETVSVPKRGRKRTL
jgi:predicted DNA-binding transcriptional regulator YafY